MSNEHQIRLRFTLPNTDCLIQVILKVCSFVRLKCVVWKLQSGHGKNMVRSWNMGMQRSQCPASARCKSHPRWTYHVML